MNQNITDDIILPELLELDIEALPRGIDNYHIDVKLSNRFCQDLTSLVNELLQQESAEGKPAGETKKNREKLLIKIRDSYQDMMTVLIHRIKTDLSAEEISFLQFAIPKYVLQTVTRALNERINQTKMRSVELRAHGSGEVLKVHHQLAWLSKNYNSILYRINRQIFEQLHRVELRHLHPVRTQYLQASSLNYIEFLFNPLLLNRDLNSPLFLIEHYLYWGGSLDESEFPP
ncbi:MAG: hypothetical protein WD601_06560, partial [Pseudohongiellaceae bacterium]